VRGKRGDRAQRLVEQGGEVFLGLLKSSGVKAAYGGWAPKKTRSDIKSHGPGDFGLNCVGSRKREGEIFLEERRL